MDIEIIEIMWRLHQIIMLILNYNINKINEKLLYKIIDDIYVGLNIYSFYSYKKYYSNIVDYGLGNLYNEKMEKIMKKIVIIQRCTGFSLEYIFDDIINIFLKRSKDPYIRYISKEDMDEKIFNENFLSENIVESKKLFENIGYIKIKEFSKNVSESFKTHYNNLKNENISGIILDLRNNPGGDFLETLEIAEMLLPRCNIVKVVFKNRETKSFKSNGNNKIEVPLVVLVNQKSASASEVLAGAIKDSNIGTIIGRKTFGKGIGQDTYKLMCNKFLKQSIINLIIGNAKEKNRGIKPHIKVNKNYKKVAIELIIQKNNNKIY